jgi:hypothetical protein
MLPGHFLFVLKTSFQQLFTSKISEPIQQLIFTAQYSWINYSPVPPISTLFSTHKTFPHAFQTLFAGQ